MAKISKRVLNQHNKAVALLEKPDLDFNDKDFIYRNYHEGAGKMNNLISAHFTPMSIARSMAHNVRQINWVDIGAGIGVLSYVNRRFNELSHTMSNPTLGLGICVENCTEYYEVGKKLLPECVWINGSIFDQGVIDEIKLIMSSHGEPFSVLSNPPYGSQVKGKHKGMKYSGSIFEYKAIEMGAILGAYDGAFLIPQTSCPFRMTGQHRDVYDKSYITDAYSKFKEQTGLEISNNIGFTTDTFEDDWKDVSITTEIAIVEYDELNYQPKENQLKMFL